jgi:hypothetical protein
MILYLHNIKEIIEITSQSYLGNGDSCVNYLVDNLFIQGV